MPAPDNQSHAWHASFCAEVDTCLVGTPFVPYLPFVRTGEFFGASVHDFVFWDARRSYVAVGVHRVVAVCNIL